ncbi:MAG: dTMP kinase [Nodosilinea sp.]
MPGKLLVFEGVEGCGKSTQLNLLSAALLKDSVFQRLQRQNLVVDLLTTREPGGTELGLGLRQLLLGYQGRAAMASRAELLLYAADRAQHVEEVIKPALAEDCWVLCDRFIDSTVAYQGYGRGLDLALIDQLNDVAAGGLVPDLTLWLKLDAATGLARTRNRGEADRIEQADLSFHQRVQEGFEALAQLHPERIVAIDADHAVASVAADIYRVVEGYLEQWYAPLLRA